ncbi:MAG TPA: DUF1254 domain-containing protein [Halieaceae bacterium]|nr:DUF1254 domain-containing protein [Halieaceae bacterium]
MTRIIVQAAKLIGVTALAISMIAGPVMAKGRPDAPPLVRQLYDGNWPSAEEGQKLRDDLFYQRAIFAYMMTLPVLNTIGMRDGSAEEFGAGYNVLPIWKDRMGADAWIPTPNADVIYSMSYLDLKKTGPLVVAAPPHVIGMFTDFYQQTITDVGAIGPDRARGGLYLLLPPDYQGHVPNGYFTFHSSTYNVFLFFRTVMGKGKTAPDPTLAVATAEQTRIYPLWEQEKDIKPMQFPNGSGKEVNMMYPTDFEFWTKLKKFVDYEPIDAFEPETRGVLASIGIVKGQEFKPTDAQKDMLNKAVDVAPRMILAERMVPRADQRDLYYKDGNHRRAWAAGTAEWWQETYLDIDQRATFFQYAYSSAPAMVMRTINAGSKYPLYVVDSKGEYLHGSDTYKLHLPDGIPAAYFWAVTAYNITDGTMPKTSQAFPSKNSLNESIVKNSDGSVDIYLGPKQPDGVAETNWIQTIEGRDFMGVVRLYGTEVAFFDQKWRPGEMVKQ